MHNASTNVSLQQEFQRDGWQPGYLRPVLIADLHPVRRRDPFSPSTPICRDWPCISVFFRPLLSLPVRSCMPFICSALQSCQSSKSSILCSHSSTQLPSRLAPACLDDEGQFSSNTQPIVMPRNPVAVDGGLGRVDTSGSLGLMKLSACVSFSSAEVA